MIHSCICSLDNITMKVVSIFYHSILTFLYAFHLIMNLLYCHVFICKPSSSRCRKSPMTNCKSVHSTSYNFCNTIGHVCIAKLTQIANRSSLCSYIISECYLHLHKTTKSLYCFLLQQLVSKEKSTSRRPRN